MSDTRKVYVRFSEKIRFSDYTMKHMQVSVQCLISKKWFWLHFGIGSRLYNKVCNIKYNGTFDMYVSYRRGIRNNYVMEIKGEELDTFQEEYAEYVI